MVNVLFHDIYAYFSKYKAPPKNWHGTFSTRQYWKKILVAAKDVKTFDILL